MLSHSIRLIVIIKQNRKNVKVDLRILYKKEINFIKKRSPMPRELNFCEYSPFNYPLQIHT